MIKLHPYEMLYFNSFAGSNMNEAKNNFEMDYWGVSSRAVLENILQKDSSRQIKIFAENYPAKLNAKILLREQRERLIYTDTAASADYFIANYRWHKGEEYLYQKEVFSVMVGNAKIMTAFKVRSSELLYNKVNGKSLMSFFTDFESAKEWWGNNLVGANSFGAHSGLNTTRVDSIVEYSDGLSIKANNLSNKEGIILKASFWKYDIQPNSKGKFVISVEDKEGKNYFWRAVNETKTNTTLGWEKVECAVELPTLKSENDIIKIYLWNQGKKQILIDDVSINFMEEIN
jgi:hypothetical protein